MEQPMTTANQPLKGTITHTSPQDSLRFDWLVLLLSTWWVGGIFVDGWAHNHIPLLETFFTPWHAILYSGFAVTGLFLVAVALRNHARGYHWLRSLPRGYMISLWGVCIFALGGLLDLTWHLLFGIEKGTDALLSPTHLLLALGVALAASGPLRAAWRRPVAEQKETLLTLLPAILSLAYLLAIFTFFTQYASPIVHSWADKHTSEEPLDLGLASILLQTALFMGVALFAMRRWRLPLGTFALLFMINSTLGSILANNSPILAVALVSFLTGLLVDLLYQALKPAIERREALRLFAFFAPVVIQTAYFLTLFAINGLAWSVHLWVGSIFMSGVVGLLLSYLLASPSVQQE
ncbi:MAG TPA: hypothetical protein VKR06_44965 [Ktedonosporobacter sp.]|nr:hypothetical protein [Ktedonosporobacter sp.]